MEFQSYMFVQIIFLIGVLIFLGREIFLGRKQPNIIDRQRTYLLQVILFIGVCVRLTNLYYPYGVFIDEGMGAYDSWCLANFGVDSNLASFPVYLKSWGTGQSALYAYLSLPFIKVFGLSAEVYRLPMSLIGCFAMLFFYWTLRNTQKNGLLVFCISAFLAITPWHIIKSRFGVDCNIFPDLLLIGMCFVILAYYSIPSKKRSIFYILGFTAISFSAYGYAVSWLALPFLYTLLLLYLYRSDRIKVKIIVTSVALSFLILVPLLLFVYVLFFDGAQFEIGQMTITKLNSGRHESTTLLATENFTSKLLLYLKDAGRLFILGVDNTSVSTLPIYGVFYNVISLPFLVFGLYKFRKETLSIFFFIWLLSSLLVVFLVEPNVNHWNIIWFPVVYFSGYGIYLFVDKIKENQILFLSIYGILFSVFLYTYFDKRIYNPFNSYTFKDEIVFAQKKNMNKVYYPSDIVHSFILFYAPVDPYRFAETRQNDEIRLFPKSYDNVVIGLPDVIEPRPKTAYVVPNDFLKSIDLSKFKIRKGNYYYSVIWND